MPAGINIILVDDENLAREGLSTLLRKSNANVVGQAENGNQLFQLLKNKKPDVILLDLEMPVLNGSKTLNRLKKEYPNQKVIMLSKYHDEELIKNCLNRGASAFLSKNSEYRVVAEAIKHVHEKGFYEKNLSSLFKNPARKDGHYYKMILTPREISILRHLCEMRSYEEIGELLNISARTVENHSKSIYTKLKAKNRLAFTSIATKLGFNYIDDQHFDRKVQKK